MSTLCDNASTEFQWTVFYSLNKSSHVNIPEDRWRGLSRPVRAALFVSCLHGRIEESKEHHHKAYCLV